MLRSIDLVRDNQIFLNGHMPCLWDGEQSRLPYANNIVSPSDIFLMKFIFKKVLNFFGGLNQYIAFHQKQLEEYFITTDKPVRFIELAG